MLIGVIFQVYRRNTTKLFKAWLSSHPTCPKFIIKDRLFKLAKAKKSRLRSSPRRLPPIGTGSKPLRTFCSIAVPSVISRQRHLQASLNTWLRDIPKYDPPFGNSETLFDPYVLQAKRVLEEITSRKNTNHNIFGNDDDFVDAFGFVQADYNDPGDDSDADWTGTRTRPRKRKRKPTFKVKH